MENKETGAESSINRANFLDNEIAECQNLLYYIDRKDHIWYDCLFNVKTTKTFSLLGKFSKLLVNEIRLNDSILIFFKQCLNQKIQDDTEELKKMFGINKNS